MNSAALDGLDLVPVECELTIRKNPNLEDISALFGPSNLMRSAFVVENNPKLATCELEAIADQLPEGVGQCVRNGRIQQPRLVSIDGNDDTAVCE
jgi:hypothetical protein